jgi:hypothetical protein
VSRGGGSGKVNLGTGAVSCFHAPAPSVILAPTARLTRAANPEMTAMPTHSSTTATVMVALVMLLAVAVVVHAGFPPASKLPSRPELPDPLMMLDGSKVTTKEDWVNKRRPELKELFQHYMYGYLPPPEKITAKVERVDKTALGGKATLKEVTIAFGPESTPKIQLLLVIPNKREGKAPVFVGMNFRGNHTAPPMQGGARKWTCGRLSRPSTGAMRWRCCTVATSTRIVPTNARAFSPICRGRARNRGRTTGAPSPRGPGASTAPLTIS